MDLIRPGNFTTAWYPHGLYITISTFSDESDDDEDDDEQELQAELDRIREERAAAQAKKLQEEQEMNERLHRDTALKSNPLLNSLSDESAKVCSLTDQLRIFHRFLTLYLIFQVKRRWNDDVVFRNQTKDEPEHKKRFINDTIRSDFHRSFLKKFVQ